MLTQINNADQSIIITGHLVELNFSQRLTRALKKFLLLISITIAAVFIPVAHFVLVPVFLILSVYFFFKEFKIKQNLIITDSYNCLNCQSNLLIPKELDGNLRMNCKNCHQQYKLSL